MGIIDTPPTIIDIIDSTNPAVLNELLQPRSFALFAWITPIIPRINGTMTENPTNNPTNPSTKLAVAFDSPVFFWISETWRKLYS